MAVWGNVRSRGLKEDAKAAAGAALAMRRELRKLNRKWAREGTKPFAIGIGINQGEVVGGNIGSQEKMDPTVIGDAVNLASRLEGLTRTYGVDILVGSTAAELIRDEFRLRSVARVQVKGKTEPVEISTLVGARGDSLDPELSRWLETYEAGIQKFRERNFTQAKILFRSFWNFIRTISWPRCISNARWSTSNDRRMRRGTQSRCSRRVDRAANSFLSLAKSSPSA